MFESGLWNLLKQKKECPDFAVCDLENEKRGGDFLNHLPRSGRKCYRISRANYD